MIFCSIIPFGLVFLFWSVLCREHICDIQRNLQFSNLGGEFLIIIKYAVVVYPLSIPCILARILFSSQLCPAALEIGPRQASESLEASRIMHSNGTSHFAQYMLCYCVLKFLLKLRSACPLEIAVAFQKHSFLNYLKQLLKVSIGDI